MKKIFVIFLITSFILTSFFSLSNGIEGIDTVPSINTWIDDVEIYLYDIDGDGYDDRIMTSTSVCTNNLNSFEFNLTTRLFDTNDVEIDYDYDNLTIGGEVVRGGSVYSDLSALESGEKGEYTINITLRVEGIECDYYSEKVFLYPQNYLPPKIEIYCFNSFNYVDCNETIMLTIEIRNHGVINDSIYLQVLDNPPDWSAILIELNSNVNANSSKEAALYIIAPDSLYGTRESRLTIKANSINYSTVDSIIITTILEFPDFTVSSSDITFSNSNPKIGEKIEVNIEIFNIGTISEDHIDVKISNETSILCTQRIKNIEKDGGKSIITYNWNIWAYSQTIWIEIDYNGNITEFNENNNIAQKTVTVNQTIDFEIFVYDQKDDIFTDSVTKNSSPGWESSFLFRATNTGNIQETITLEILDIDGNDEGWKYYFSDVSNTISYSTNLHLNDFTNLIDMINQPPDLVYLNENNTAADSIKLRLSSEQTVFIKVKIRVPTDILDITQKTFHIKGSTRDPELNKLNEKQIELNINILLPDLVLENISYPEKIKNGDMVNISVQIGNTGDIEAKFVEIALFVDDEEIDVITLVIILSGESVIVTFHWKATSKPHNIKIVLDKKNTIIEKNDQFQGDTNNNIGTEDINVDSKDKKNGNFFDDSDLVLGLIFVIIISIIIVIIIIIVIVKNKSKKIPPPEPPTYSPIRPQAPPPPGY